MTADKISNYLCNIGAQNIDIGSIIETLKEMQSKSLINKLYRPIETINTTSKTPQSTPSTVIVELNTTLRVLSIGSSSLNARLEALETKLCEKFMAMKSYFMDELRSLKQEAPVTKKWDYNQDETNALKNTIKLSELENQLLKCDVSNKQKIIDTILEHNSKLIHNIDVSPARSTTYDHHMTSEPQHIRENQNGETSDTAHSDRRKHDYKPNRENKKSDDNDNKKKEIKTR